MVQVVHPVRLPFKLPINEQRTVDRFVYAYLVIGEQVGLVDTGAAGSHQGVLDVLAAHSKTAADIDWVINTHEHPDHIIKYFDQIFDYMKRHEGVLFLTGEEILDWYLAASGPDPA